MASIPPGCHAGFVGSEMAVTTFVITGFPMATTASPMPIAPWGDGGTAARGSSKAVSDLAHAVGVTACETGRIRRIRPRFDGETLKM